MELAWGHVKGHTRNNRRRWYLKLTNTDALWRRPKLGALYCTKKKKEEKEDVSWKKFRAYRFFWLFNLLAKLFYFCSDLWRTRKNTPELLWNSTLKCTGQTWLNNI